jgi:hypothetical protein
MIRFSIRSLDCLPSQAVSSDVAEGNARSLGSDALQRKLLVGRDDDRLAVVEMVGVLGDGIADPWGSPDGILRLAQGDDLATDGSRVIDSRLKHRLVVVRASASANLLDGDLADVGGEPEDAPVGRSKHAGRMGSEQRLVTQRIGDVASRADSSGMVAAALHPFDGRRDRSLRELDKKRRRQALRAARHGARSEVEGAHCDTRYSTVPWEISNAR